MNKAEDFLAKVEEDLQAPIDPTVRACLLANLQEAMPSPTGGRKFTVTGYVVASTIVTVGTLPKGQDAATVARTLAKRQQWTLNNGDTIDGDHIDTVVNCDEVQS